MKKPAWNNLKFCLALLVAGLVLFLAGTFAAHVQAYFQQEQYNDYNLSQMGELEANAQTLQDTLETTLFDNLIYTQLLNCEKADRMKIVSEPEALNRMLANIKNGSDYIIDVFLFSLANDIVVSDQGVYSRQDFFKNVYELDYSDIVSLMTIQQRASAKEPLAVTKFVYHAPAEKKAYDTIAYLYTPAAVAGRANTAIIIALDKNAVLSRLQATLLRDSSGLLLIGEDGSLLARNDAGFLHYGYEVSDIKRQVLESNQERGVIDAYASDDYAGVLIYHQALAGGRYYAVKLTHPETLVADLQLQSRLWRTRTLAALVTLLFAVPLVVWLYRPGERKSGLREDHYASDALAQVLFEGRVDMELEAELVTSGFDPYVRQAVACRVWLDGTKRFLDRHSAHAWIALLEQVAVRIVRHFSGRYEIMTFVREELVVIFQAHTSGSLDLEALVTEMRDLCDLLQLPCEQSISARFGSVQEGVARIRESYRTALCVGKDTFSRSAQCSVYEGELPYVNERLLSPEQAQSLSQWLLGGKDPAFLSSLLEQIFPYGEPSEVQLQKFHELFRQVEKCCALFENENDQEEYCLQYGRLALRLMDCCSRQELLETTERLFQDIREEISALHMENDRDNLLKKSIAQYLEENYARDFSLVEIAEHFGLSPAYFSRMFKSLMGSNMVDYLHLLRMRKFKEYVAEHGDMPIKDVAKKVGYNSYKTFSRQYKKIFGTLPSNKIF